MAAALPPGAQRRASSFKTRRVISATAHGLALAGAAAHGLGKKQVAALRELAAAATGLPSSEMRDRGFAPAIVARLLARGLATARDENDDRDPFEGAAAMTAVAPDALRELTSEQSDALKKLIELSAGAFRVALLHGVTGSGNRCGARGCNRR
jgi:primosomal protein N'